MYIKKLTNHRELIDYLRHHPTDRSTTVVLEGKTLKIVPLKKVGEVLHPVEEISDPKPLSLLGRMLAWLWSYKTIR